MVTSNEAGLWTDSRYFLEAENAVTGTEIRLNRVDTPGVLPWHLWISRNVARGSRIGIDTALLTLSDEKRLLDEFEEAGLELVYLDDPFAEIWPDRPELPAEPVYILDVQYAGRSATEKITAIRTAIRETAASAHVVNTLDDIAWILNLRGSDVPFNPVFLAFLVITPGSVELFSDGRHFTAEVGTYLSSLSVTVRPYESFRSFLTTLTGTILLDPEKTSTAVRDALQSCDRIVRRPQPSTAAKAVKCTVELDHVRNAMVRDGVSMVRFLKWLEEQIESGERLTELQVSMTLTGIRKRMPEYVSDSFRSIVGANSHGAIVHYSVTEQSNADLERPGVCLVDSGAQYKDGTTDITRTVPIGSVPDGAAEDFTLVLKAHIALAELVFPRGWSGRDIDAIARRPLWLRRRNYGHGTGHGVGFFLNVHEGPHRIAPTARDYPLEAGMIVSNEPGLYREGRYGIRIENLLAIQNDRSTEFGEFLRFETLTVCPIDRRMIDTSMLTQSERDWINAYHERVREAIAPHLNESERAWLISATARITEEE